MSARGTILTNIRRSLGANGSDAGRRAIVIARLDRPPRGIVPERGQLPQNDRVKLFQEMAEKVSASVTRVASSDAIPGAITTYLRDQNLPAAIRMGDDAMLTALPWKATPQIEVSRGPSKGDDAVTVELICEANGWRPVEMKRNKNGAFRTKMRFPKEGEFQFLYRVNEQGWLNDDTADEQRANGFGGTNSVLHTAPLR